MLITIGLEYENKCGIRQRGSIIDVPNLKLKEIMKLILLTKKCQTDLTFFGALNKLHWIDMAAVF